MESILVNSNKGGSKKGRKLKTLTTIEKKSLCEYKAAHPNENNERIAELFQIGKSTVGDILRTKDGFRKCRKYIELLTTTE